MGRVSSHTEIELRDWEAASLPADEAQDPAALAQLSVRWFRASVPGTIGSALRADGHDVFREKPALDASDHFYRCKFEKPVTAGNDSEPHLELEFEGLATLAQVWLNGEPLFSSDSMYVPVRRDVTELLRSGDNELLIRFRSLDRWLEKRRARPRWRTRLTDHAQLRWIRTSLLGRMPGWSPPVHAVGPWRPVRLNSKRDFDLTQLELSSEVTDLDELRGRVQLRLGLAALRGENIAEAELRLAGAVAPLRITRSAPDTFQIEGELEIDGVALWWPHTHGAQPLYSASVVLRTGARELQVELGAIGFRRIEVDKQHGGFALSINGVPIFCRGASWTTTDALTLTGTASAYNADLERARAAGMNMLRISGTLFYEASDFYRRCDELGILVWQDFMFANMDYPIDDPGFATQVDREADAFLRRVQRHPSLAVLCGGSEVEQQVAMLGLPRNAWRSRLFDEVLPRHANRLRPDVPYIRNTPSGGDLPFDSNSGVSHYYGVGAYLRPLDDARRAEVRFASECLAFANVPEDSGIAEVLSPGQAPVHHPAWKERVPRDFGASWDFEDVRDHYLHRMYGYEPNTLRYADSERYLALSRVVSGEVMAAALGEWRRARSTCRGALIWFYRDLWPGAGLGLLDASGRPKAAYHFVQRALAPIAIWFSDEGLNGLHLHLANDRDMPLVAELQVCLHNDQSRTRVAVVDQHIELAPRETREIRVNAILPWFADATAAYRFGPPPHDLAFATLRVASGELLADAVYFPNGLPSSRSADLGLRAQTTRRADGSWQLRLTTERFAYAVTVEVPGHEPDHDYVHVLPGVDRLLKLAPVHTAGDERAGNATSGVWSAVPIGSVRALNGTQAVKITHPEQTHETNATATHGAS